MNFSDDLATRWTPSKEQDELAFIPLSEADTVVTAHLLVNKEQGWWGPDVMVVHLPGIFADRDTASDAIVAAAKARHEETGLPVTGGWTYHHLPKPGEPSISADGTAWKTSWAVFEDILAVFPEPTWRKK